MAMAQAPGKESDLAVFVRYQVPVFAEIAITSGRVIRVQVDDEAIGDIQGVFVVDEPPLTTDLHRRVLAIAEGELWPAWEFGS